MSETDKQEGQKTVVAFVAGLLIGGLLVWVFSSSPENTPADQEAAGNADNAVSNEVPTRDITETRNTSQQATNSNNTTASSNTEGSLKVANQPAGTEVAVDVAFPTTEGWVAVRDLIDGVPGSILGAARYNTEVGLTPQSVTLLRGTEAGKSYEVMFYTEDGDSTFDPNKDLAMEAPTATFTAQ